MIDAIVATTNIIITNIISSCYKPGILCPYRQMNEKTISTVPKTMSDLTKTA